MQIAKHRASGGELLDGRRYRLVQLSGLCQLHHLRPDLVALLDPPCSFGLGERRCGDRPRGVALGPRGRRTEHG